MDNVSIIYATVTKHSKRIAEALSKRFDIKVHNITEEPELNHIDLLFIIGGIYGGVSSPKLITYVEGIQKEQVKKVALITSCLSKRQYQTEIRNILTKKGIEVIDEFVTRGGLLFLYMRHPNKKDIEDIISFSTNMIQSHI